MGSKKHRDKDKKINKDKKSKKEKKSKHRRRRRTRSSDSSSDGSSSGDERIDVKQQLAMGRAAARATREVLAYKYELRKDLRELARQLDSGGALDISGLPDAFLRARLSELFSSLVQLRKNSAGQYYKRTGDVPSVLSFIAPILEESPDALAAYKRAPEPQAPAAAADGGGAGAAPTERRVLGPAAPPLGHAATAAGQQEQYREGLLSDEDEAEEEAQANGQRRRQQQQPGSVLPPGPAAAAAKSGDQLSPEQQQQEQVGEQQQGEEEQQVPEPRRVVGPAMPPAELLAAAAQMEYPESEAEEEVGEEELMVGPPPPELAEEVDRASMDERGAEVVRVMRVLSAHAATHADASHAEAAENPPDAYEVLGIEPEAPAGDVKKRYWRLSLLIHPDKCDHAQAHDAFQAVSVAAKQLQDAGLRRKVDERRQDARLRKLAAEHVAAQERERQWRLARGEATAEDLAGPVAMPGQMARDTWMTELPPERQAVAGVMPTSGFQGFSSRGKQGRGDTRDWTMTPAQRALQLEGGSAAGQPLLLAGGPGGGGGGPGDAAKAARTAAAVDTYNAQIRKKSLVELHAERQAEQSKRKKQKTGASGAAAAQQQDWDRTQHPWQPWDREKEMGGGSGGTANAQKIIESSKNLGARFGSSQRTFL